MRSASSSNAVFPESEPKRARAKSLYQALLGERGHEPGQIDELTRSASRSFLNEQMLETAGLAEDFPADVRLLPSWLQRANDEAGQRYRSYLDGRCTGEPRRFFTNRAHALHFLRAVAPTKLVDGAWLYGVLQRWDDPRLYGLVRIYLEELGEGLSQQNHVVLYRQLLRAQECDPGNHLSEEHFTQGAIQLSLAHHAAEFLPEVIGFNLGYEQLPLHLLITAYELNELGIDPYYFTLHVTVDNAATGHARKSTESVLAAWPRAGDRETFYRRVADGFRLSMLGLDTMQAIASFDLDRELLEMLAGKAAIGANLHSDYCRVGGRTISQWLGAPGQLPEFLQALQAGGWIARGQEAQQSRFWRLLRDDRAPMFGVFTAYEQQLLKDWIEQPTELPSATKAQAHGHSHRPMNRFRQRQGGLGVDRPAVTPTMGNDFDAELQVLEDRLASAPDKAGVMALLSGFMSPANHHLPAGLHATRLFTRHFAGQA